MSDLISRQAAIEAMQKLEAEDIDMYGVSIPEGFDGERAVEALRELPSAEPESKREWYQKGYKAGYKDGSPEIIRCKDCEYIRIGGVDDGSHWYYCDQTDCDTEWDGYCHRAKRRTDEQAD